MKKLPYLIPETEAFHLVMEESLLVVSPGAESTNLTLRDEDDDDFWH